MVFGVSEDRGRIGIYEYETIKTEIYGSILNIATGMAGLYIARTGEPIRYYTLEKEAALKLAQELIGQDYIIVQVVREPIPPTEVVNLYCNEEGIIDEV